MGVILSLIIKDLRRSLASPAGILVSLAIPLAISGTMALAFGNRGGDGPAVPKMELVVVDLDKGPLSDFLAGAGQNSEATEYISVARAETPEEGLALMKDEGHHAMVVIPKGFTDRLLESEAVELELVKNPARRIMPIVAQQGLEVAGLYGSVGMRILPAGAASRLKELFEGEGWEDAVGITALITDTYIRVKRSESLLFPPIIKVVDGEESEEENEEEEESGSGFNYFDFLYPGIIVMSLLFVGLNQMKDLLAEQDAGTLRRLLAGPVTATQFLISKILSVAMSVAASLAILLAVGVFAFGVSWGDPLALVAASLALVFAVTGFSALLYSFARTQNQGDAIGGILVIVMSLLGGTLIPQQMLPGVVKNAAQFTLSYWGNETFRALSSGGEWSQLSPNLPVLALMGLLFTVLGTVTLKMRHMKGAL